MSKVLTMINEGSSPMSNNPMNARRVALNALLFRAWNAMERTHSIRVEGTTEKQRQHQAELLQKAEQELEHTLDAVHYAAGQLEVMALEPIVEDFVDGRQRGFMPRTEEPDPDLMKELGFSEEEQQELLKSGVPLGFKQKAEELKKLGFEGDELVTLFKAAMAKRVERAKERLRTAFMMGDEFIAQAVAKRKSSIFDLEISEELAIANAIIRAAKATKNTVARSIVEDWSQDLSHEVQANHLELKALAELLEPEITHLEKKREELQQEGSEVDDLQTRAEQDAGVRPACH